MMDKFQLDRTWTGFAAACKGLITSCFPLVCRMWSESGLQATEYTGVPANTTRLLPVLKRLKWYLELDFWISNTCRCILINEVILSYAGQKREKVRKNISWPNWSWKWLVLSWLVMLSQSWERLLSTRDIHLPNNQSINQSIN